ncbi:hypothetical protein Rs2_16155 [Raphanus sativus]|nr:hypothetical protein Rs2_16155 [Raphanus sativus]
MTNSTGKPRSSSGDSIVWSWVLVKLQTGRTGGTRGTVLKWDAMNWRRIGAFVLDSVSTVHHEMEISMGKTKSSTVKSVIWPWFQPKLPSRCMRDGPVQCPVSLSSMVKIMNLG